MVLIRRKFPPVEAMQFNAVNAVEIISWACGGWENATDICIKLIPTDKEGEFAQSLEITETSRGSALTGDWVLRYPDGRLDIVSEQDFSERYEVAE